MDVSSGYCYKTSLNYKFMAAIMVIITLDLPSEQSSGSSFVEVGNFPSATCTKVVKIQVILGDYLGFPPKGC